MKLALLIITFVIGTILFANPELYYKPNQNKIPKKYIDEVNKCFKDCMLWKSAEGRHGEETELECKFDCRKKFQKYFNE